MELDANREHNLELLIGTLENFRKLDIEMPIQYVVTFLSIALREKAEEGLSIKDLEQWTHLSQSATSRNVQALSKWFKPRTKVAPGVPGHDLVETFEDPMDRRKKIVRLTPKGRALQNTIAKFLEKMNEKAAEKGGRKVA